MLISLVTLPNEIKKTEDRYVPLWLSLRQLCQVALEREGEVREENVAFGQFY